ncbi:MAG: YihA family ribosome biogenesis GTP-binding protein [Parachlamydiaceae bacterium]|nr:YihA family ribosome biogenesis GTP-binding protein [Parachlamydiaceae bacterium]
MKNYLFKNAKFCTTATKESHYPVLKGLTGEILLEIAVAGRSNVGKSSLLNHLFHSKGLVKTSSTPGKTQAMNFFMVNQELVFVDLPGYGYANVPNEVRRQWGPMVQEYLQKRDQLKLILFLFDIRRMPQDDDKEFLEWAAHNEKAVILVLTKVDKVTQNERSSNTKKILQAFDTENLQYVHYSVVKNTGHKEISKMICEALNEENE